MPKGIYLHKHNKVEPKKCLICDNLFYKKVKESITQWNNKKCCSQICGWKSVAISQKGRIAWNKGIKLPYQVWNKGLKGVQTVSEENKKKTGADN